MIIMFMPLFVILATIIIIAYLSIIFFIYKGWLSTPSFHELNSNPPFFITIIIPFRNENKNLKNVLSDLFKQSINKHSFEVIAVNDHSTDGSEQIAGAFSSQFGSLSVIELSDNYGKKHAIHKAMQQATGELIVTLDADCRVDETWLSCISAFYLKYKPEMIILPVISHTEKGFLQKIFSLEFMSLVASGAGAAGIGRPIMCNGANMAFTRKAYFEFDDPTKIEIPSGDDMFLMMNIKKKYPGKVLFLKSQHATAYTHIPESLSEFVNQRARWASKSRFYKDADVIATAVIVFLISLLLTISLALSFFNTSYFLLFIGIFIIKSVADWLLLTSFARFFNKQFLLKWFIPAQLFFFLNITFTAVYGNIAQYKWKSRTIRNL
jgi:biofilm PGA synthesis N-glycosyltransferase PgaC